MVEAVKHTGQFSIENPITNWQEALQFCGAFLPKNVETFAPLYGVDKQRLDKVMQVALAQNKAFNSVIASERQGLNVTEEKEQLIKDAEDTRCSFLRLTHLIDSKIKFNPPVIDLSKSINDLAQAEYFAKFAERDIPVQCALEELRAKSNPKHLVLDQYFQDLKKAHQKYQKALEKETKPEGKKALEKTFIIRVELYRQGIDNWVKASRPSRISKLWLSTLFFIAGASVTLTTFFVSRYYRI